MHRIALAFFKSKIHIFLSVYEKVCINVPELPEITLNLKKNLWIKVNISSKFQYFPISILNFLTFLNGSAVEEAVRE